MRHLHHVSVISGIGNWHVRFRASSAVYLTMTSALVSSNSRSDSRTISPWFIQTLIYPTHIRALTSSKGEYIAYLFAHFPSDMRQSLHSIKALSFYPTTPKHLNHLRVFLTIFSENEFTLVIVVFVLSTSPIFASLREVKILFSER